MLVLASIVPILISEDTPKEGVGLLWFFSCLFGIFMLIPFSHISDDASKSLSTIQCFAYFGGRKPWIALFTVLCLLVLVVPFVENNSFVHLG